MLLFHVSIVKERGLCPPGSGNKWLIDLTIQNPLISLFMLGAHDKGQCGSSPGESFCGVE